MKCYSHDEYGNKHTIEHNPNFTHKINYLSISYRNLTLRKNYTDSWQVTRWTAKNIVPWKLIWKHTTLYLKNIRKAKIEF